MGDEFNISMVEINSEYIDAYDFEVFDVLTWRSFAEKWRVLLYFAIIVYSLGIYFGKKWMEKREPFQLNKLLFFWNAGLAIFSILATIRSFPETAFILSKPNGTYLALCDPAPTNYTTLFWGMLFIISKVVELGDTAFIVARKQKLIFLHWFHHIVTLFGCWITGEYIPAGSRLFFINTFVHSIMYSYYALKALKVRIPKKVAMTITIVQILQMLIGAYLSCIVIYVLKIGLPCRIQIELLYFAVFAAVSFLTLFVNFFVRTYFVQNKQIKMKIK